MDILDKHDLLNLLRDPELKRGRGEPLDPLVAALEQFFTVEIPARERVRAQATASTWPVKRSFSAVVRVLSPHNAQTDEQIVDQINTVLDAHPIRITRDDVMEGALAKTLQQLADSGLPIENAKITVAGKKPARARKAKRWAGRMGALVLIALAACGAPADDDLVADDVADADADAGGPDGGDVDAGPDGGAPDAGPGLAQGSDCDPTIDECAIGLACRVVGFAPVAGRCEFAGPLDEGDHCAVANGDADCGAAMACLGDPPTAGCYLICDRADPAARCGAGGTCAPAWGESVEIGACAP